jgi:hypothetical protein
MKILIIKSNNRKILSWILQMNLKIVLMMTASNNKVFKIIINKISNMLIIKIYYSQIWLIIIKMRLIKIKMILI